MVVVGLLSLMAVLVTGHAVGTYAVARLFGFRVLQVSLGFGPRLVATSVGGAKLTLNLLPIMSYVKLAGMNPLEPSEPSDSGSFANGSRLAKVGTLLAGPLGIFMAGWCFFVLSAGYGYLTSTGPLSVVDAGADNHSFQVGDALVAVNGQPVDSVELLSERLMATTGTQARLQLQRSGTAREVLLDPSSNGDPARRVSFGMQSRVRVVPWSQAPRDAWLRSGQVAATVLALPTVLLTTRRLADATDLFSGWLGARAGGLLRRWLSAGGALGVCLALLNLAPFPALNGGRILFVVLEALGQKLTARTESLLHGLAFVVMLLVGLALVGVLLFGGSSGDATPIAERAKQHQRLAGVCSRWGLPAPPLSL